ncbi:hypothetical protein BZA05DRAFT_190686 [Tricharina praecox]|uniref:uncharacterized protein n=1 Tax=Tricharina praecox TaxID=43433 RepID=UPI00221FAB3C|nr:uncharacterized protein BZA05DRAFT_190686 [Tricharina praecox]KAI5842790.1 hypothetical protein BZA05DRAFT_190686 [Tricharina praecox]
MPAVSAMSHNVQAARDINSIAMLHRHASRPVPLTGDEVPVPEQALRVHLFLPGFVCSRELVCVLRSSAHLHICQSFETKGGQLCSKTTSTCSVVRLIYRSHSTLAGISHHSLRLKSWPDCDIKIPLPLSDHQAHRHPGTFIQQHAERTNQPTNQHKTKNNGPMHGLRLFRPNRRSLSVVRPFAWKLNLLRVFDSLDMLDLGWIGGRRTVIS